MRGVSLYLGEDGCGRVAVSSESFVELVQGLQHRFLVLILPQCPVSDQPVVVIQRAAEPGGAHTALLRRLLGFHRVTFGTMTTEDRNGTLTLLYTHLDFHLNEFTDV